MRGEVGAPPFEREGSHGFYNPRPVPSMFLLCALPLPHVPSRPPALPPHLELGQLREVVREPGNHVP
jgi:hypothetical protein